MKDRFPVYEISNLSGFKQEDILISRFAPYLAIHKNLELPHRPTFYHLVLFTEGNGNHVIDFQRFPVEPYQIYFMVPGQVHGWNFAGVVDGYVINFSAAFFNSFLHRSDYLEQFPFFSGVSADEVILIPESQREKIKGLFEEALEESENSNPMAADLVRVLILQMFITIGRLGIPKESTDKQTYNHTLLRSFQKLVDKNYTTLRLPKEYASLLFITPNHLNALCNQALGIAAGTVIRNRIALEAKRLLVNFELTITEISGRLNFQDNSYFTRFFKKQEGITPEEFRKEIKKTNDMNTLTLTTIKDGELAATKAPYVNSEFKAALHCKCPKCRTGNMFANGAMNVFAQKMNEYCPHCGFKFEIEPGYFYVAMFVSYAMNVAVMVTCAVGTHILTGSNNPWVYIAATLLPVVVFSPFTYRYARIILLYWLTPGIKFEPKRAAPDFPNPHA